MTGPVWPFEQACAACGAEIGEQCFPGCVGKASAHDDELAPWVITDADGIVDRFVSEQERDEALLTGEYPDDVEPAYVADPGTL